MVDNKEKDSQFARIATASMCLLKSYKEKGEKCVLSE